MRRLSLVSGCEDPLTRKLLPIANPDDIDIDEAEESGECSQMVDESPWEIEHDLALKNFEIAITGRAFQFMLEVLVNEKVNAEVKALYKRVILHAMVYARMSPDHKALLVSELQNSSKDMVAMCGDGANDCKALKTADVGLSLSEAEASIAAPFTSKIPNISPIIKLLREGRTSIVTCFQVFKFMALYSMIQFSTCVLLYNIASNLGNWQFLFIDLFIIIPLSMTMSRTGAYHKLSKSLPTGQLISFSVLLSVISHIIIMASFQVGVYFLVIEQEWYTPVPIVDDKNIENDANTTLFSFSLTQYIIMVIVFSVGKPFRKPLWTNISLMIFLVLSIAATYVLILVPPHFIVGIMEMVKIPFSFRLIIAAISIGNLVVSYSVEKLQI